MSTRQYKHLFGPVPSRRFGRSLGIDLTPFKTCSLNCVFCQLGQTTTLTAQRREYVPTVNVLEEIDHWLANDGQADVVTFAGSGEPTLHSGLGDIARHIRQQTDIPLLLLTNGSLLHLPKVREDAAVLNRVKVSLSAWDQASYETVNRPCPECSFEQLVSGEIAFREEFDGQLFLEVFLLQGINSSSSEVERIAEIARRIRPDRVQLNTAVRPPAENVAVPVTKERLLELAKLFSPEAEVIAEFNTAVETDFEANEETVLSLLKRRPCTAEQVAAVFHMHRNEVSKYLGKLLRTDAIQTLQQHGETYYSTTSTDL
ncbi:MAG: radical SAM protein [Lentisphaeria bacterium]|nr:radical SAM protein [Lentisphaeria bacterium]